MNGAELNVMMLIGDELINAGEKFSTYYGIHDETYLGTVSCILQQPDVAISILSNYITETLYLNK